MKTASSLTLIAALSASPIAAFAQTATDDASEAAETEDSGTSAESEMSEAADEMKADADAAGDKMEAEAEAAGDKMEAEAEAAGDEMEAGADAAGDEMKEAEAEMETDAAEADGMAAESTGSAADQMENEAAETDMAESEPAAKPVEGQITMQDEDTILASDLIGTRVYSTSDDDIGEINDVIVGLDGAVEGVVIGVGGFLGIGEKSVAVEMSTLSVTTDEDGDLRLVTSATKPDLEAAEAFMSKDEQESARAASTPPAADATNGTGIGGTADPAADPAAPEASN